MASTLINKSLKQRLVDTIEKVSKEEDIKFLLLTEQVDINVFQKDIDYVFLSRIDFLRICKVVDQYVMDNHLKVIKRWKEKNKNFLVLMGEDDTFFGIDIMLGFSDSNREVISCDALNSLLSQVSDANVISLIKSIKALNKSKATQVTLSKNSFWSAIKSKLSLSLNKVKNFSSSKGGGFVVFIGPDGAGKTTIMNRLIEDFESGRMVSTIRYHLRAPIIAKKNRAKKDSNPSRPHQQPQRSAFMSVVKICYILFIYNIGYLLRIWPHIKASKLVFLDRYYYDLYADPIRFGYTYKSDFVRFMGRFIPKPDLLVVLTADAKVLTDRKDDLTSEQAEKLVSKYKNLSSNNIAIPILHMDTDNDVSYITDIVRSEIYSRCFRRS